MRTELFMSFCIKEYIGIQGVNSVTPQLHYCTLGGLIVYECSPLRPISLKQSYR